MMRTKYILTVLVLIMLAGFGGCASVSARHRTEMPPHANTATPWWENGGIDIDWPY